jgi:hypothetical protein
MRRRLSCVRTMDESSVRVRQALLTRDNRLKQGAARAKVMESYERALVVAREAGIEDRVGPLLEVRLADLRRLQQVPPPLAQPEV